MKKRHVLTGLLLVTILFTLALSSCKKDPIPLTLEALLADDIDLNGLNAATGVSVNPTIVATFATNVDATTATASTITLTEDYDDLPIPLTIAVSGKTITLTITDPLANGALYQLTFTAGLKAINGLALDVIDRYFTTTGSFAPRGLVAYWNFNDNTEDQVGDWDPLPSNVIDITYATGRSAAAGKAAVFNGTSSIIEAPRGDLLLTDKFSFSYWVKIDTTGKKIQFDVIGAGSFYGFASQIYPLYNITNIIDLENADGTTIFAGFTAPCNGSDRNKAGYEAFPWLSYDKDLTGQGGLVAVLSNKWVNLINVYNGTTRINRLYLNGVLVNEQDYNVAQSTYPTTVGTKYAGAVGNGGDNLVIGFTQDRNSQSITWYLPNEGNRFKGQMDDIRFFNKDLSASEVSLMYNSEKP